MLLDWEKGKSVPVYLNSDAKFKKYIYILLYQHHYYTIKSIAQFYECNRYCHRCKKNILTTAGINANQFVKYVRETFVLKIKIAILISTAVYVKKNATIQSVKIEGEPCSL